MNNNLVKVGIIGVGGIGSAHAASIYGGHVDGMKLCALCDVSQKRRDELSELYPDIPIYSSDDELFASADVDAIIIATPHYFHPPIAIKGFEKGLHVLTEKPAGVYCSAVKAMTEAAKKNALAIIENAKAAGAEMIITACPLCKYNLEKCGADFPVVYFTELLAEALGVKG